MNEHTFKTALFERLKSDLPGNKAHRKMIPTTASGRPVKIRHKESPQLGAVMILIYREEGEWKFPLIQRPQYEGVHSGQMALPGGKQEEDDRSLIDTAVREMREEIGIGAEDIEVVGSLSSFFVAPSNFQVLPIVGFATSLLRFMPDRHEVEEVVSVKVSDLTDNSKRKKKRITVAYRGVLEAPYFDLEGKVVWGATAMMLNEFAEVLHDIHEVHP